MTSEAFTTGEALATSGVVNRFCRALASATVSGLTVAPPPPRRPPRVGVEVTSSTLEPSASIWDSTADEEPVPTATRTITEPTPIISPRMVSPDRSLLAASPLRAMRIVSITGPAPAPPLRWRRREC